MKKEKMDSYLFDFSLLLTAIRLINPLLVSKFFDNASESEIEYLLR